MENCIKFFERRGLFQEEEQEKIESMVEGRKKVDVEIWKIAIKTKG